MSRCLRRTHSVHATYGSSPGYAGFSVTPLTLPLTVKQVEPNGPAQLAGLEVGDQITSIDGVSTQGMLPQGLTIAVRDHASGSSLTLGIVRASTTRTIEITIGN